MADKGERRLTAILSADVAGYSKLMGDDEHATVLTLTDYREVFADHIARHKGHVVDSPGDNLLAEFASPVEAVNAAIDIQHELGRRNRQLAEHRQMHFRIGLNLGDVIAKEDGTIYGDGVNIAARLEGLAAPGGICLSETIFLQTEGKVEAAFEDIGAHEVKNIAKPVRTYRVVTDGPAVAIPSTASAKSSKRNGLIAAASVAILAIGGAAIWQKTELPPDPPMFTSDGTPTTDPVLAMPTGPSIAVLPFDNLGSNTEQDYFGDGLAEQIITQLARFPGLVVVSRNASFQYRGEATDIKQVGKELGARFVIDGSVRKSADTIRVTAQLLDASNGTQLWAETYDRKLTAANVFAMQDNITQQVVGQIASDWGVIGRELAKEGARLRTEDLDSYQCVLRAYAYWAGSSGAPDFQSIRDCVEASIARDPEYVDTWIAAYFVYQKEFLYPEIALGSGADSLVPTPNVSQRMLEVAQRAVALDAADSRAHMVLALAHFYLHQLDEFYAEAEIAIALNPNNSNVLGELGNFIAYSGKWQRGVDLVKKAMALNPHYPTWFHMAPGKKYFWERNFPAALEEFRRVNWPGFWMNQLQLAYTLGHMPGREREAKTAVAKLVELYPGFTIDTFYEAYRKFNFEKPFMDLAAEGLRNAGLDTHNNLPLSE